MRKIIGIILAMMVGVLLFGCAGQGETNEMDTIRNAPIAKLETPDNHVVYVDSEIASLRSFADLEIHEAPPEPGDQEEAWQYRITFNPCEKVSGNREVVVTFHDSYIQINSDFYFANEGVAYQLLLDWAKSKFDYFFQES